MYKSEIENLRKRLDRMKEQVRELQEHRDNARGGSGGMPSYSELEAKNERLRALESAVRLLPVEDWVEQHPLTGEPMLVGYYMQTKGKWDNVKGALAALEGKDE